MFFVCSSHVGLLFWFRLHKNVKKLTFDFFGFNRHMFYQPIQKHTGSVEDYFKNCLQLFFGIANYRNTRCS